MMRGPHSGAWTLKDRIMALALIAYEQGICGGCGLHHSVTHGDENVGRWETGENICHGCEPIEAERAKESKDTYPGQQVTLIEVEGF